MLFTLMVTTLKDKIINCSGHDEFYNETDNGNNSNFSGFEHY